MNFSDNEEVFPFVWKWKKPTPYGSEVHDEEIPTRKKK